MEQAQRVSRLGMFTASGIWQLCKSAKGGGLFGQQAMTYIHEKIAEIVTGECKMPAKSFSMDWGNENERDAYMWLNNIHPHEYLGKENFKFFEYNQYAGGSPDGLSEDTVYEYKCPFVSSNHIEWLLNPTVDWLKKEHFEYYAQLQFNMACCKRNKGVIASYDPRTVESKHRMAIIYVERDNEFISDLVDVRIPAAVSIITQALQSI